MRIELLKKGSFRTATWAGGTTTELFIHPGTADCGARDFEVRVSSATVEIEESVFSDFKGYVRHIAPIEGCIRLVHEANEERGEVMLAPGEANTFDGAWCTRSYGKCVDFNLIHRSSWQGGITALKGGDSFAPPAHGFAGFFVLADDVVLDVEQGGETQCIAAEQGDFLLVRDDEGERCTVAIGGGDRGEGALAIAAFASQIG